MIGVVNFVFIARIELVLQTWHLIATEKWFMIFILKPEWARLVVDLWVCESRRSVRSLCSLSKQLSSMTIWKGCEVHAFLPTAKDPPQHSQRIYCDLWYRDLHIICLFYQRNSMVIPHRICVYSSRANMVKRELMSACHQLSFLASKRIQILCNISRSIGADFCWYRYLYHSMWPHHIGNS